MPPASSIVSKTNCAAGVFYAVIAMLVAAAQALSAQAITIVVTNAERQPLVNATVRVNNGSPQRVDSAGQLKLTDVRMGGMAINVRALGYEPRDSTMVVEAGENLVLVELVPVEREAVVVTARANVPLRYKHTTRFDEFYRRKERAVGTFFTRDDIERSQRSELIDILRTVPGLTIDTRRPDRVSLIFARCRGQKLGWGADEMDLVAVYFDGMRITQPGVFLRGMSTVEIEAIEVYRGASQLPQEAMGNACAAIFIHSRFTPGSVLGLPADSATTNRQ